MLRTSAQWRKVSRPAPLHITAGLVSADYDEKWLLRALRRMPDLNSYAVARCAVIVSLRWTQVFSCPYSTIWQCPFGGAGPCLDQKHIHTNTHIHTHTYTRAHTDTNTHTHTQTHTDTDTDTHIHTHTHRGLQRLSQFLETSSTPFSSAWPGLCKKTKSALFMSDFRVQKVPRHC